MRLQLVLEPLHDGRHPARVDLEPEPERVRVLETCGPRGHDATVGLIRLETDETQRIGARDGGQRGEFLAYGGREAGEADDTRVRGEARGRDAMREEEVARGRLRRGDPEREVECGGSGRVPNRAVGGQALEGLAYDGWCGAGTR